MCDNPGERSHLSNAIEDVIAVVEMKYKKDLTEKPFLLDIKKTKDYIMSESFPSATFYLAFIHEIEYIGDEPYCWLKEKDFKWARGKVVELNAYFSENDTSSNWEVISY